MSRYHAASRIVGKAVFFDIPIDGFTLSGRPRGPYVVYFPSADKNHGGPPHVHVRRGSTGRAAKIIPEKDGVVVKDGGDFKSKELGKIKKQIHAHAKRIKREWYKWQASA